MLRAKMLRATGHARMVSQSSNLPLFCFQLNICLVFIIFHLFVIFLIVNEILYSPNQVLTHAGCARRARRAL